MFEKSVSVSAAFVMAIGIGGCSVSSRETPLPQNLIAQSPLTLVPTDRMQTVAPVLIQRNARTLAPKPRTIEPLTSVEIIHGTRRSLRATFPETLEIAAFNNCALYPRNDATYTNNRWVMDCSQKYSQLGTFLSTYVMEKRGEEKANGAVYQERIRDMSPTAFQG